MTIMSLKNLLKQGGYEFEIAENGNDGVEKVKASSFDLVFIDFNLPDMGGDAVLSKIKESGSNYGKSVLMSGDENLNSEFENKGFNYFLQKLDLLRVVKRLLKFAHHKLYFHLCNNHLLKA